MKLLGARSVCVRLCATVAGAVEPDRAWRPQFGSSAISGVPSGGRVGSGRKARRRALKGRVVVLRGR